MYEWFIKHWHSIDTKVKFPVFVSVLTFSLGFVINELIKSFSKNREKKSFRKSLFFLLDAFATSCKKQSNLIRASVEKGGFTNNNDFIINTTSIHSIDYLVTIDSLNLVNKLDKRNKHKLHDKALSKLIVIISQVHDNNIEMKELLAEMMQRYTVHENDYQTNLLKLRDLHDDIIHQVANNRLQPQLYDFVQAYRKIFVDWHQNSQDVSFNATHKEIVRKVIDVSRQFTNETSLIAMRNALSADLAYINIEKVENRLKESFKNSSRIHDRAYRLFKPITKILKSHSYPFVNWFY